MKSFYFLIVLMLLGGCTIACLNHWTMITAIEKQLEVLNNDTEIEDLQNTQDQWIKQTELLKTVNQLSSNLKFVELEKKELADALNVYFENTTILKSTIQRADIIINKLFKENESLRNQLKQRST